MSKIFPAVLLLAALSACGQKEAPPAAPPVPVPAPLPAPASSAVDPVKTEETGLKLPLSPAQSAELPSNVQDRPGQ